MQGAKTIKFFITLLTYKAMVVVHSASSVEQHIKAADKMQKVLV